jgi:hypothetical protein
MAGVEVSPADLKRLLPESQRAEVDRHLAEGKGVAIFADERGRATTLVSYGTRDADLPGPPPGLWGGGQLHSFVPAVRKASEMRSPLKAAIEDQTRIPQIARPRVSPTQTSYPEVLVSGRVSSHPRGNGEYLNLVPGRAAEPARPEPPSQEPLSEASQWWAQRLREQ